MQGCPKLPKRSQLLVGRSSPYYEDTWIVEDISVLNKFFPIVDTCLSCEDITRQSCAMVPRWRFLVTFLLPVFSASHMQHISYLHSKFALRHTMCGSMVDIQSPTAEIRRGNKKEEERRKKQDENIMVCPVT